MPHARFGIGDLIINVHGSELAIVTGIEYSGRYVLAIVDRDYHNIDVKSRWRLSEMRKHWRHA